MSSREGQQDRGGMGRGERAVEGKWQLLLAPLLLLSCPALRAYLLSTACHDPAASLPTDR